jgi:GDP-L-fucose synthase
MTNFDLRGMRVWVTGHRGTVGSAICRRLASEPCDVITIDKADLDLRRQADVESWFAATRPDVVILSAATVGGIGPNFAHPADFIYNNLAIQNAVIPAAHHYEAKKLIFLGSSCIYPRSAPQPFQETALLSGPLEPTNQWYATAKIAGVKMCQAFRSQHGCDFISVMPSNIYGPGDNFHPENSHAAAALLRKIHEAKTSGRDEVTVWGSGTPRREWLFVDDLADAIVFLLRYYSAADPINIGSGQEVTIRELATSIARIVGYPGRLTFDKSRPDGMPRKIVDTSRLRTLGWTAPTTLEIGLAKTYEWFTRNHEHGIRL